jgi:probable HAF family extracellular repeat protein
MHALPKMRQSWIVLTLAVSLWVSQVYGQVYQITDLGTLPGQTTSTAVGINRTGQVAGTSGNRAFLYSNGALTDLGFVPGSSLSSATAINNTGQIIGIYTLPTLQGRTLGFLWDNGTISDPFGSEAFIGNNSSAIGLDPVAINDSGQVMLNGVYNEFGNGNVLAALLWQNSNSQPTNIGTQAYAMNNETQVTLVNRPYYAYGALWTSAGTTVLPQLYPPDGGYGPTPLGINDEGEVVGEALVSVGVHAFEWSNGVILDLGTLGGVNSTARGVNNTGQIVGDSELVANSSSRHAFVYSAGQMLDLNTRLVNPLLWQLQSAVGINDLGQIAGTGTLAGVSHAFLLTPQASGSVYPTHGGNAGKATVLIVSPGFVPSAIQLVGGTTISGSAISVPAFLPTAVQVTFDLTGVLPGVYSLALTQGSSAPINLSNVFTVDQGGAPDVRISVAGFPQLRAGLQESYYVEAENVGNVDSGPLRVWVSFPTFLQWQPAGMEPSSYGVMNGNDYLAFDVSPTLGATLSIPLVLTGPSGSDFAHRPFQINAWEAVR